MVEVRRTTAPSGRPRGRQNAIWGWLLFVAVETATQITFKYAGATLDDRAGVAHLIAQALTTPVVLLGFALYFCGFLIWMTILKDVDLGRAFPMTAIIYVSTLASAVILFHEMLNPVRIAGVLVIACGVALLASDQGSDRPGAGAAVE
ncbi:MAG TPA: EamA family transporter [Phenylobacterium sp.]|nr:EamA family transporter [Phenylobacterium sp.]